MKISETLLRDCRKEKRRAQEELYRLCYSCMLSVCFRYERNKEDAEFLLNKAFFKVLTKLDTYQSDKVPFEAWIRRITINTVIDEYRKNKKNQLDYVEQPMDFAPVTVMNYNEADQQFEAEELQLMIEKLPPVSKQVFNLYAIDGFNHREIGEKLNMSEGTSKWHLSSARKKLQALLRKALTNVAVFL
jgi:RNA polymerase sigma factor (sigma-70 family)